MPINKVVYNEEVLIDLTGDTVDASKLLAGVTAHKADGSSIVGILELDVDDDTDRILLEGFTNGTKSYSSNGRIIKCVSSDGRILTKTFSEDMTECSSVLSNQNGISIASSITKINLNGLSVVTTYSDKRVLEKVFDADLSQMKATLKSATGEVIREITINLDFAE